MKMRKTNRRKTAAPRQPEQPHRKREGRKEEKTVLKENQSQREKTAQQINLTEQGCTASVPFIMD